MLDSTAMQHSKEDASVKLATKEELSDRLQQLYDSLSRRAFEIFEGNGGIFGHDLDDWFKAESELLDPVHVDLAETDSTLTVRAEIPGFSAKGVQVSLVPDRLTILGKRETQEERKAQKSVYRERCSDRILRVIDLPAEVDPEKTTAALKNGVLTLEMPKASAVRKTPVETKAA